MHARRLSFALFANLVGALGGLVSLFFIGRFMSPAAYGMFGFAFSFVGLSLLLSDLGLERAHVRHVTAGHPVGVCHATFRLLKTAAFGLYLVGVSAAIAGWLWFGGRFHDATSFWILVLTATYGAFFLLRTIPTGTLTALKLTGSVQVMVIVEHLVKTPLIILAALTFGFLSGDVVPFPGLADQLAVWLEVHRPRPSTGGLFIAGAWAAGLLVSLLVGNLLHARQSFPAGGHDGALARSYVAFAIPVALAASLRILFMNVDAVFIGWFLSAENVGYYFAADRLSMIAYTIPVAVQVVYFPLFGELASRGDRLVLTGLGRQVQRFISLVMMLVAVFFVVFPGEGIRIFVGEAFLPAKEVLPWLSIYLVFLSLTLVASNVLMVLGRPYTLVRVGLVTLLVNVVLDALLIPDRLFGVRLFGFHSAGAAFASALAQLVAVVMLSHAVWRAAGSTYLTRSTFYHIAAAIVTGALLVALRPVLWTTVGFTSLALAALVAAVIYFGVLVATRELGRADLRLLRDAVHPRRLVAELREEIKDKRLRPANDGRRG